MDTEISELNKILDHLKQKGLLPAYLNLLEQNIARIEVLKHATEQLVGAIRSNEPGALRIASQRAQMILDGKHGRG